MGDERSFKLGKLGPGQRFSFKIRVSSRVRSGRGTGDTDGAVTQPLHIVFTAPECIYAGEWSCGLQQRCRDRCMTGVLLSLLCWRPPSCLVTCCFPFISCWFALCRPSTFSAVAPGACLARSRRSRLCQHSQSRLCRWLQQRSERTGLNSGTRNSAHTTSNALFRQHCTDFTNVPYNCGLLFFSGLHL